MARVLRVDAPGGPRRVIFKRIVKRSGRYFRLGIFESRLFLTHESPTEDMFKVTKYRRSIHILAGVNISFLGVC